MKILKLAGLVAIAALVLSGCSVVHQGAPSGTIERSSNPQVLAQLAYAKKYFTSPNATEFGNLGGTDCVNFTSQTLLARGWKMTTDWAHSNTGEPYTRAWISSTALHDYLAAHPELAKPLSWSQRGQVSVGDIVQFDWDASGDRDHTAIISGIENVGGKRRLLVASHSPGAWDWRLTDEIAEHGNPTKVYFWHIQD